MTKIEAEIIDRIKYQMKMKKFTQEKLAKALGTNQSRISRMLEGKPFPTIDELFIISANLDCSVQYLLGLKEESFTELSKECAEIAHAYFLSNETVKVLVRRLFNL